MRDEVSWAWSQIKRKFWFRVSLFALAAVAAALLATYAAPFIPKDYASNVNTGTARDLLSLIASSMLVVATFSLGTMVAAYAAISNIATPRATRVLIDDPFSQNVLSTFLGAFVFGVVGLVAESFSYYDKAGEVVMLAACGVVIALVIATLFAWIDHLANMVRLGETVHKIETRAEEVMRRYARNPWLGGMRLDGEPEALPGAVHSQGTGYVRFVDAGKLNKVAEGASGRIAVVHLPGTLADPMSPLARTSWTPDDAEAAAIRNAFTLGHERSFDQDPRYCLAVIAEIASRALSPGINDPGTAIGIIASQQHLLTLWARDVAGSEEPPAHPRVMVPDLTVEALFQNAFGPILRDGAGVLDVGIRLQKSLAVLATAGPQGYLTQARRLSLKALRYTEKALVLPEDQAHLEGLAARVGNPGAGRRDA